MSTSPELDHPKSPANVLRVGTGHLTADLQAIEQQRQRWIAAVNARDVDQYVSLLTTDVVWFPPGQPALHGREEFEAWVRPFFERFRYEFSIPESVVRTAGDWAIDRGQFQSRMTAQTKESAGKHSGQYLVIWRREDVWRIERYVDLGASLEETT